jgi:membrane protease YdiL (CAAX protease family)
MGKSKPKTKKKKKTAKSTLATFPSNYLNYAPGSYLEATSRPLYALVFLIPLIGIYEFGTIIFNTQQIQNIIIENRVVTFTWLIKLARWSGLDARLVWAFPGFVIVLILLCWHLASRHEWTIRMPRIAWMALESVVLAIPLIIFNAAFGSSNLSAGPAVDLQTSAGHTYFSYLITGIGAGIYEELIFRLILIGLIIMFLEDVCKVKPKVTIAAAIILSSLLFSAHHYFGFDPNGIGNIYEPFVWGTFIFRTLAGIYLALIFSWRGYGIAVGAHAAYDIILKTLW